MTEITTENSHPVEYIEEEIPKSYKSFRDVKVYLDSKDYSHHLVTYPNGKSACSDIDIAHLNKWNEIVFIENKMDYMGWVYIPRQQMALYQRIAQAEGMRVLIVATKRYRNVKDTDMVYYCDIEDIGDPVAYKLYERGMSIDMNTMLFAPKGQFNEMVHNLRATVVRETDFPN